MNDIINCKNNTQFVEKSFSIFGAQDYYEIAIFAVQSTLSSYGEVKQGVFVGIFNFSFNDSCNFFNPIICGCG